MGGDSERRFFLLVGLPGAQPPDDQADQEKRRGRQQQQAVGDVPAAFVDGLQDGEAEQLARAEQFAGDAEGQQHDAVAQAVADAVEKRQLRRVLHRKGLGAAHHDAVGDDQPDEHRQLLAERKGEGLEGLIDHDHQRGDDHHLHDHPDR